MLIHVIRKELLDQLLSLRFAVACIVCLLVFACSSIVLTREYREAISTYHMNQALHRNEVLQRNQIWEVRQGITVDRPPNVMTVLVQGTTSEAVESIEVQPGNRLRFPKPYEQNPVVELFPEVDFAFIVGLIMSLLALAFSYDAVAGEREKGVLKLVMSYSVPRHVVLLGKWIGGYLALIAPFLVGFLVGLVIVLLFPEVESSWDNTIAIAALLGVALLYLAAVYSLGILVSCRTQVASTAIAVLLLLWVVFILAVPNVAPYLTSQFLPVPSLKSVERHKTELRREGQHKIREMALQEQERAGSEEFAPDDEFQAKVEAYQEEVDARIRKVEESYSTRLRAQTRWSSVVARISPLTSFHLAALDLAAVGIEQESRFVDALKTYSKTWDAYSIQKREAYDRYLAEQQEQSPHGRLSFSLADMKQHQNVDFGDYPRFEFHYMDLTGRLGLVFMDLLLLVLWNLLLFMLAHISFLRYDVH